VLSRPVEGVLCPQRYGLSLDDRCCGWILVLSLEGTAQGDFPSSQAQVLSPSFSWLIIR
jgi:hypothetical protein